MNPLLDYWVTVEEFAQSLLFLAMWRNSVKLLSTSIEKWIGFEWVFQGLEYILLGPEDVGDNLPKADTTTYVISHKASTLASVPEYDEEEEEVVEEEEEEGTEDECSWQEC